jgi:hypothetical protein
MKSFSVRHAVLLVMLIATLAAVYFAPTGEATNQADDLVVGAADRTSTAPAVVTLPSTDHALPLERLTSRRPTGTTMDPFRATMWFVPPPPPPPSANVTPPAPTAPPLPFQYNGKQEDADSGKNVVVYLTRGTESFAVTPGEKFDRDYQFEKIDKGALVIVYLPLAIKQRLPMGTIE